MNMKIHLIFLQAFQTLFLIISCSGDKTSNETMVTDQSDSIKREQIHDFWISYRLATKKRVAGDFNEAIASYRQALALNDQHEDALYYLGNMYLELKQYGEAEKTWEELLVVNPASSRAHYQLGNLYMQWENIDYFDLNLAEKKFKKVLDINSDFLQPVLLLGQICLIKGKTEEAKKHFSTVISSNDKSIESHLLSGFIYWKQHDDDKALSFFNKAVEYASAEKKKLSHSGEGDTKGGISLERSLGRSIFNEILTELASSKSENNKKEMENMYRKIENLISAMKK